VGVWEGRRPFQKHNPSHPTPRAHMQPARSSRPNDHGQQIISRRYPFHYHISPARDPHRQIPPPQATASAPTLEQNLSHGRLPKLCQALRLVNQSFFLCRTVIVSYSHRVICSPLWPESEKDCTHGPTALWPPVFFLFGPTTGKAAASSQQPNWATTPAR
jgi:hypothetical protein